MDRKTYEDRRRLGYRDDPRLISEEPRGGGTGRLWLLCLASAIAGGAAAAYTQGALRIVFALLALAALLALVALPVLWLYKAIVNHEGTKRAGQVLLVALAADAVKSRLSHQKRKQRR